MSNLLNTDFDDSESEDDAFNPAPEEASDDEGGNASEEESGKPVRAAESARSEIKEDEDDNDEDDAHGDEGAQRKIVNGNTKNEADREDDDEEDAEGEDEEGGGRDEEEDEEDEEEDEEEEVTGRPRKRRKRDARLQFIDVEAEVDDEDEEEEEGEEDLVGDEAHPDDLADLPAGGEHDDRRHRELDRQRELAASMDAEKQAEALREKYGRQRRAVTDNILAPQHLLLPDPASDPKIWMVRCKPGKEKDIILQLMKRLAASRESRNPLQVSAAFEREGPMSGSIYVEAWTQQAVMEACDGISFLYPRTKIMLISVKEMPELLRTKKDKELDVGAYVRVKRGLYANDLAEVTAIESNGAEVEIRLIPRIDYGQTEDLNGPNPEGKRKRPMGPNNPRPPARLFSEQEAKKKMSKHLQASTDYTRKRFTFRGKEYIDGYLVDVTKITNLQVDDVNPTLEEVSKFASKGDDGSTNLDLDKLAKAMKQTSKGADFLPGDNVEIYQGEQQGVSGRAVGVRGDVVSIRVIDGVLKGQTVDAPVNTIRKKFKIGDHVKVTGASKFQDEVGMVTKVTQDRITFVSDSTLTEIEVFSKDLREAADQSGMQQSVSKFDLYDLVQLDAARVGVVIKVDRESVRVLDQENSVRTLLPSNISHKLERRRHAVATDRDGSEIRNDDTVKEYGGESRQGRVLHIHRSYVFVQDRNRPENAGVFCSRSTNVTTVAAKGGAVASAGPDLSKMNPALQPQAGPNGMTSMGPPKTMGRDRLIGKTVMVRKGPHKGLLGIVKDATDTEARVELHSKNKTISIPKETLSVKDPITGQTVEYNKFGGARRPGGMGAPQTPFGASTPSSRVPNGWQGSRTPMGASGSATPAWGLQQSRRPAWEKDDSGGKTPGWSRNDGGRTPGWVQDGSRTVAHRPSDGSRTSYGGATSYGGSTWQSGSKTPAPGSHGDRETWGSGSRTPYHSSSSRTPNPYASAPTPGAMDAPTPGGWHNPRDAGATPAAFDAPTPGVYGAPTPAATDQPTPGMSRGGLSAPTPGAIDAPTPGGPGRYSAPTPGAAYAETPGAWAANTPAAVDDDDPRYE